MTAAADLHWRTCKGPMTAARLMEGDVASQSPTLSKKSWITRWLLRMTSSAAERYPVSGLVAFYWAGGSPRSCTVGNISSSGIYVITEERWRPGCVIPMTLQRVSAAGETPEDWIAVIAKVVRVGPDGRGLAFSFSRADNIFGDAIPPERVADRRALLRFLKRLKQQDGIE